MGITDHQFILQTQVGFTVRLMGPYVLEDQNVHQGNSLVIDLLAGIQFMGSLSFPTLMLTKGGGHLFEGFRVNP